MAKTGEPLSLEGKLDAVRRGGAATVHEVAGSRSALPSAIRPLMSGARVCGPAFPVETGPGDNIWIHRAVYLANPGDVLVISCGGLHERGYWGEILSMAALHRGLAGAVIDGCARDIAALETIGLPVFGRGLCVRGTTKDEYRYGGAGKSVTIGEATVRTGDIVVGDGDGVVIIDRENLDGVVERARARMEKEEAVLRKLADGATSMDLLGFGED